MKKINFKNLIDSLSDDALLLLTKMASEELCNRFLATKQISHIAKEKAQIAQKHSKPLSKLEVLLRSSEGINMVEWFREYLLNKGVVLGDVTAKDFVWYRIHLENGDYIETKAIVNEKYKIALCVIKENEVISLKEIDGFHSAIQITESV